MSIKRLFFDFDGTIADSSPGIFNGIRYACKKLGLPQLSEKQLKTFVGPPLLESFQKQFNLTAEKAEAAVVAYREYYKDQGLTEFTIYSGMAEILAQLSATYEIYVATSKPELFAKKMLQNANLADYFKGIYGADLAGERIKKADVIKYGLDQLPIMNSSEMIMVGDRSHDIIGAKANHLRSVGVLFGFGSQEEFIEAGADWIIEKPQELLEIVKKESK
ncbi:phosphoglycolate phosphatase [Enterococcus sp. PF1-24]|uniref:HAD hydrolase-like protein n=1 Tax=unclassified Enterococcus TaxID=2608891 RepID=UPI002474F589|nr:MULTISPECIES: HAD hydrolase-like protein [unclassified Enterococcus]MDH6365680.1 phosphoglycolate phosphatase [Enterococcus sp. PFB1-1]MDH6402781.1 phosphoglycolate phosphatase [Enterococcus sp. PF1-24]